jgi:hypothetical protein
MMLYDPEEGQSIKGENAAGRQGGGREIISDNECYSETKKNRIWGMSPGVKPDKCYLALWVKMANEVACDHVGDKLYPPFLNLL